MAADQSQVISTRSKAFYQYFPVRSLVWNNCRHNILFTKVTCKHRLNYYQFPKFTIINTTLVQDVTRLIKGYIMFPSCDCWYNYTACLRFATTPTPHDSSSPASLFLASVLFSLLIARLYDSTARLGLPTTPSPPYSSNLSSLFISNSIIYFLHCFFVQLYSTTNNCSNTRWPGHQQSCKTAHGISIHSSIPFFDYSLWMVHSTTRVCITIRKT